MTPRRMLSPEWVGTPSIGSIEMSTITDRGFIVRSIARVTPNRS